MKTLEEYQEYLRGRSEDELEDILRNLDRRAFPDRYEAVLERLEGQADWAYTTVKTMLTRLEEKGAISSYMKRNTAMYEPILTRRKARSFALQDLMDRAFDGAFGQMLHFLVSDEELSAKEREELLRLADGSNKEGSHDIAGQ